MSPAGEGQEQENFSARKNLFSYSNPPAHASFPPLSLVTQVLVGKWITEANDVKIISALALES